MHPLNMGRLALGRPGPLPCTPAGIEALLAYYEIPVAGQEVVIPGRGVTLGRPLALLLAQKRPTANAAVTVVHTGVSDWDRYTRRADILVAAVGVPGIIQPRHVKPGAVVIGGGVRYEGRRLLPDIDEACASVAGAITPRVGGVGPTTVAMLFRNAINAAERAAAERSTGQLGEDGDDIGFVPRQPGREDRRGAGRGEPQPAHVGLHGQLGSLISTTMSAADSHPPSRRCRNRSRHRRRPRPWR